MMRYRDAFGELQYELGDFFVPHRKGGTGKYVILKREAWYVTDAWIITEGVLFDKVPVFDSFIQAVRFLKENIKDLV